MYWLPFLEITGNWPVSSVYSLLMWVVLMWISFFPSLGNTSGGIGSVSLLCFIAGLVDRTCCLVWTICPFIVSLQVRQYLVAFWYVSPGHESKFPATWLKPIKAGNFASWPGLTYQNATKYCPTCKETIKGNMFQTRQHVRSTRPSIKHSSLT